MSTTEAKVYAYIESLSKDARAAISNGQWTNEAAAGLKKAVPRVKEDKARAIAQEAATGMANWN